jgi:hypothetical protein
VDIQNNPRVIEAYLGHSQPMAAAADRTAAPQQLPDTQGV